MSALANTSWEQGRLCTLASASRTFFESLFGTGQLRMDHDGDFWDAVAVAHASGAYGGGREVAIVDSGFDMTIDRLRDASSPDSITRSDTLEPHGRHGTVVALLVNMIAPAARLLLLDAGSSQAGPTRTKVGELLQSERVRRADIVNLSMEFVSDCPRSAPEVDIAVLVDPDPPTDRFVEELRHWRDGAGLYAPGGCQRPCMICLAIDALPSDTLVIAAAGNDENLQAVCPSANSRTVGLGFENRPVRYADGMTTVGSSLPDDFEQTLMVELGIPQPAGFLGTSFAAPLVSGLAALLTNPMDVAVCTRLRAGLAPLINLSMTMRSTPIVTKSVLTTALAGFAEYAAGFPPAHQHWLHQPPKPCAVCSFFVHDWYRNYTAVAATQIEPAEATAICTLGTAVLPRSADLACNRGAALRRLATSTLDNPAARARHLADATEEYQRALRLQPGNLTAAHALAELPSTS
jgi:hypothetical protein